jgi:hypothetical protein
MPRVNQYRLDCQDFFSKGRQAERGRSGYSQDMTAPKQALLYGFFIWLIAFVISLFESIMPVVLAAAAILFLNLYFRNVQERPFREGILLVWSGC